MSRELLVRGFSNRLVDLMQHRGYKSERSKAGVKVSHLARVCGCSQQMARRYVLGAALPDIEVTTMIAKWLEVSPGWLLFGEEGKLPNNINQTKHIYIQSELLEYILHKSAQLFVHTDDPKELVSFIIDIINDVTNIDADKKTIFRIVDLSINSVVRFNGNSNGKESSVVGQS